MNGSNQPGASARWVDYLLCYLLYAVVLVLAYVVAFVIWRPAILALTAAVFGPSRINRAVYLTGVILVGGAMMILVLGAEPYLRTGVERGQLLRRFARLAVPLVIAGALGLLLQILAAAIA